MNKKKFPFRLKLIDWLLILGVALIAWLAPGCASSSHKSAPLPIAQVSPAQAQALAAVRAAQAETFTNTSPAPVPVVVPPVPPIPVPPVVTPPKSPVTSAPPAAPPAVTTAQVNHSHFIWFSLLLLPLGGAAYFFWPKIKVWLQKQRVLAQIEVFAKSAELDIETYWKDFETEVGKLTGKKPTPPAAPVVAPKVLPKPAPVPAPPAESAKAEPHTTVAPHADASWTTPQTAGK